MKKTASSLLTLLLLAGSAAAQVVYTPYSTLRKSALGPSADLKAAPAVGTVVPVKFRMEGPAVQERTSAPNLTAAQVQRLFEGLIAIEGSSGRKPTLTPKHAELLKEIFDRIDAELPEPVTAKRWDAVIDAMLAVSRENFVKNGYDWDKTLFQAVSQGAAVAAAPPNLDGRHAQTIFKRLAAIMKAKDGDKPTIKQNQVQRLLGGLAAIDMKFVDPISPERWDAIVQRMGDVAEKEYGGKTRDWDVVIDHMLQSAVADLKEPHSAYLDPEQSKALMDSLTGTLTGIGVGVSTHVAGMRIEEVHAGLGAEKAGLRAGDVIVSADGSPLAGLSIAEMVKRVRGEPGTSVQVEILREGRRIGPISVTRSKVQMPNLFSRMAAPGIGYVYFIQFSPDTGEKVLAAVRSLKSQGAKSVILDVRGNPGGEVGAVAEIASEFLRDGDDIVSFKHQGKVAMKAVTDGDGKFKDVPVVVLIDEGSASASEILSGALQDKRPGYTVIGSRSYGKGTQQAIHPQPDGRALKITENRWYTPNDRSIAAQADPETGMELPGTGGVIPNLAVEVSPKQQEAIMKAIIQELYGKPVPEPRPRDPVLEKAVEVLTGANAG